MKFNFFTRSTHQSTPSVEFEFIPLQNKIMDEIRAFETDNYFDPGITELVTTYKSYISLILTGSLLKTKYSEKYDLANDKSLADEIFQIVLHHCWNIQEKFMSEDAIIVDSIMHESLKSKTYFKLNLFTKFNRYSAGVAAGVESNQPYKIEKVTDPDLSFEGAKHYHEFLKDLFFIEIEETAEGIKINHSEYEITWSQLSAFFDNIVHIYNTLKI